MASRVPHLTTSSLHCGLRPLDPSTLCHKHNAGKPGSAWQLWRPQKEARDQTQLNQTALLGASLLFLFISHAHLSLGASSALPLPFLGKLQIRGSKDSISGDFSVFQTPAIAISLPLLPSGLCYLVYPLASARFKGHPHSEHAFWKVQNTSQRSR